MLVIGAAVLAARPGRRRRPAGDDDYARRSHVHVPGRPGGCPFPFLVHSEGTFRETVFANGKDVTHAVDFHITYTNPANGKVLTTVLAGPFIVEPNADGTVTVTINGNDGHITAPGQGTIFAAVGKLAYIADPGDVFTPLAIVKSTGRQDPSQFAATCDGLS
jgi:hypothetical protein